jgi:hypothetical protein
MEEREVVDLLYEVSDKEVTSSVVLKNFGIVCALKDKFWGMKNIKGEIFLEESLAVDPWCIDVGSRH